MADEESTIAEAAPESVPEEATENPDNTTQPQEEVAEDGAGSDGGEVQQPDTAPAEGQSEGQPDGASVSVEGDAPATEPEHAGESEERVDSSTDKEPTDNMNESEEKADVQEEKADDGSEVKEGSTGETEDNVEEKVASPLEKDDGAEEPAKVVDEGGESDKVAETEAAQDGAEEIKADAEGAEGDGAAAVTVEGEDEQTKSPIPQQSDTFTEGEQPEDGALVVGEQLSREGSPVQPAAEDDGLSVLSEELRPISPSLVMERHELGDVLEGDEDDNEQEGEGEEEEDEEEEEEEEEEELQPEFDRDQLIERYHAALAEKDQLQQQNYQLQHKLAEYFRKKKSDDSRQDFEKNVTDQEQRYLKYMATLEELHRQESNEADNYQMQIEEVKDRCQERQERVDEEKSRFIEFKKLVALNALNSRSGKPIAQKDIEQYLLSESKKEGDVVNVRLENIKLKNKLRKKEQQLKSKEELAEGLHLIDFEQLKIENQTYNEKIEERNEELLKLRKKITSTVQVLTHLKEKLQFVQAENQVQSTNLRDVEMLVAQKRDVLSRTKQARDALRIDNQRLRQNSGLLGNEPLLRDFEERKDESGDLRVNLERLKMQHAELTLNCNQVRRKIEQVRGARQ